MHALAEAHGYRITLLLAHQRLAQLPADVGHAVDANTRNKIYFTVSPDTSPMTPHPVFDDPDPTSPPGPPSTPASASCTTGWLKADDEQARVHDLPDEVEFMAVIEFADVEGSHDADEAIPSLTGRRTNQLRRLQLGPLGIDWP